MSYERRKPAGDARSPRSPKGGAPVRRTAEGPAGAVSPWAQLRSASFHPFIYKRMLAAVDSHAQPGDLVNVYDKDGALFGRGLLNLRSEIALRMLSHGPAEVGESFWRDRLAEAVALRRALRVEQITDAYRIVHAEGDGLSGLIAERYGDCIVYEVFSLGVYQRLHLITPLLQDLLGPPARLDRPDLTAPTWRVIVRADERVMDREGFHAPEPDDEIGQTTIREHDVRYRVDMAAGHKTGFFCDQRDNRLKFARLCDGADVLDCCCYTAGFGLCAKVLGGATEVTSVDLDEAALAVARENVNLNQTRINLVHSDAFTYLRQMIANGRVFDRVVLDPPKLAPTRRDYDDALKKYWDLNFLAAQVVRPGGMLLTCSCSGLVSLEAFTQTVNRALRRAGRTPQVFDVSGAAGDHPVRLSCPESAYLKALWLRVL